MDKFVKILASQNPKIELVCSNNDCKKKTSVKTTDFFSDKSYTLKCPYCGKNTEITDIESELEKAKKNFKKSGITW